MRQLFAVALVFAVVATPVCAQHGGGHGGGSAGFHGGFSGRPAFAAHGGVSQGGNARYAGGSGSGGSGSGGFGSGGFGVRYGAQGYGSGYGAAGRSNAPGGFSGSRPVFYTRGRSGRPYGRRLGSPYAYPVPLDGGYVDYGLGYGVLDNDSTDYGDSEDGGYYDDSANGPVDDSAGQGYEAEPQGPGYPTQGPSDQAQGSRYPAAEEPAQRPVAVKAQTVAPALYDSDAVTLVFKDGRPLETIHNYALTRTTLYVTDAHRREIPVAELDLAATEKANREAGVNFQLPVAGR